MDRNELEGLDRDALIARAEAAGVTRARILTRPELIDELLLRSAQAGDRSARRARGLFGRARDLLARVIELGLNLPDAADRLRGATAVPASVSAAALPTVTLAEIYAAQGHRGRAVETLKSVLEREPDHAAARALHAQLSDSAFAVAAPALPPEEEEPPPPAIIEEDDESSARTRMRPPPMPPAPAEVDDGEDDESSAPTNIPPPMAPTQPRLGRDACTAFPSPDGGIVVRWQAREATIARLASAFPRGRGVLRVLVVNPTWEGPQSEVRDLDVEPRQGEIALRGIPDGAIFRAAVGWRTDDGFAPIAHV